MRYQRDIPIKINQSKDFFNILDIKFDIPNRQLSMSYEEGHDDGSGNVVRAGETKQYIITGLSNFNAFFDEVKAEYTAGSFLKAMMRAAYRRIAIKENTTGTIIGG